MLEYYLRPLTPQERQNIHAEVQLYQTRLRRFLRFTVLSCLIILVVGVPFVRWQASRDPNLVYLGAVVLLVYLGIVVWVYLENRGVSRTRAAALRSAMQRDEMRVLRCQTAEMIEIVEIDDEGATYLFQAEPDRILCLTGQQYYATPSFPSTDFMVVEVIGLNGVPVTFEIYSNGETLKPARVIGAEAKDEILTASRLPEDFDILDGALSDVEQRLLAGQVRFSELTLSR